MDLFFLIMTMALSAFGESREYRIPVIPPTNTKIALTIPYTFGTHKGEARLFSGKISIDNLGPSKSRGNFSVPINSLGSGNDERDCHMMEALGLDYSVSDYPESHVCTSTNNLPVEGKNAPKYPTINLIVHGLKSLEEGKIIFNDKETEVEVDGEWVIHGKSYRWLFPLKIIPEGVNFRVKGEVPFSLRNHDVILKPAKVLFIDISVKDIINVNFDILLEPDVA